MSRLPFALFQVSNSPITLGLTLFEIMYVRPPPIMPHLRAELLAEFDGQRFIFLPTIYASGAETILASAVYEKALYPVPHSRPRDYQKTQRRALTGMDPTLSS